MTRVDIEEQIQAENNDGRKVSFHKMAPKSPSVLIERVHERMVMGPKLMTRADSMILTFHVPPRARGQGLCDFDSLKFGKISQNWEVLARRNQTDYSSFPI